MIATSPTADPTSLARALLSAAAEVEAAEARIRQALLDAARAGDCARVIRIVEEWARPAGPIPRNSIPPAMLDVQQVADLLGCSTRTVRRMVDAGDLPAPRRLGALVRWPREAIETWVREVTKPARARRRSA